MKAAETLVVRETIFEHTLFRANSGDEYPCKEIDVRRHSVNKPKPHANLRNKTNNIIGILGSHILAA
jgi:hypothetical protein